MPRTRNKHNWRQYWDQIYEAAVRSLRHPGGSEETLPKEESPKYPEIYLFRHGETYDNRNRVHSGHRDSRLTSKGIQQAEVLREKLKGKDIDICIVSLLSRSIDTAKIIFKDRPDIKFETDNRIIERDYGELTGKSKEKLMREDLEQEVGYRRGYDIELPGGENLKQVEERVFPFCEELVERMQKHNINVAVSAHGNSMRAMRAYFENMDIVEELIHENPLGEDYAEYIVKW